MAYDFSEFKKFLKFQFGNRTDLESVDGLNLYGVWVNSAYKILTTRNRFWAVQRNFKFPQLRDRDASQATVDGTAYIDVPSDAVIIHNVYDTENDRDLAYIKPNYYYKLTDRANTSAEGEPTQYTRAGDRIYLYPTPDDAYDMEIEYRRIPSDLTGENTTAIGEEWDDAIVALASYIGFSWLHEYDKAKERKEDFLNLVSGLIGIYDQEERGAEDTLHADPMGKDYGFE